jgi:predicted DNA-binding transcriptional regulator AlpA
MIEIDNIKYITDKEASHIYGYSVSWFQKQRAKKLPPPFIKLQGKGKVYYSVTEINEWFVNNIHAYKDIL